MLAEFAIVPVNAGRSLADEIAEVLKLVDESGLPYQLTPAGTCVEGSWNEVMELVRRCHEHARRGTEHVVTTIKIEDEAGAKDKLRTNVAHVEAIVGKPLRRDADTPAG